ncbi:MAG: HypC/HybG/HupF family hydrogenase formation chaperone [Candidatus Lokiarchaeota archaeon]|nr:HypC/HybG/HupF family hydrogenase formation chaperone [Candidatus Lokiarchaeota archaeon]
MCLAIPGKVMEINGPTAIVDFNGVQRDVVIGLCPNIEIGSYVVVHAGYAIEMVNEEEALKSISLWQEMIESEENFDQTNFF